MKVRTFQAIVTKYIGPSNVKGSRIKAKANAGSVILSWDGALDTDDNHHAAAKKLANKFDWVGEWHCGALPDNSGNCYVCSDIGAGPVFVTYDSKEGRK
jgi:hypothetical protein